MAEALRQVDALPDRPPAAQAAGDSRDAPRFTLLIRAAKLVSGASEFLCVLRDASELGVSVRLFHPLPADLDLTLELPNGDRHPLERVWEEEGKAGFRFREPVELDRIVENRSRYARRSMRVRLEAPCSLVAGDRRASATIGNLSQEGALIRTHERLSLVQRIRIGIEGGPEIAARVRWRREDDYGVSFEDSFQFAELAALTFDLQREALRASP
jgi:hypothetical protein